MKPYLQDPAFRGFFEYFVTWLFFYGEELLATRSTPKLEDHPLSAVRDFLFNIFAATLHIWTPFVHPKLEEAQGSTYHGFSLQVKEMPQKV
jgi:hypothetical protein